MAGVARGSSLYLLAVCVLLAGAEPAWKSKPISQWTAEDAKSVLTDSPWVKHAAIAILPQRSESQMREGGKMGGGGSNGGLRSLDSATLDQIKRHGAAQIRWESAAPVRAAEFKAREEGAPDWDGNYYAIAVYGVPGITPGLERNLRSDLRQTTFLKRAGKRDLRPERVDISLSGSGLARIVYLFPRSAGFTFADEKIEFVSQIGRLFLSQVFETGMMIFDGRLEL